MKRLRLFGLAAVLFMSATGLVQTCNASSVPDCDGSHRIVGAFGAENASAPSISLAADVRAQLPQLRAVRRVLDTQLSPSGEQVVIYDTADDESDPHPKVAFVVAGRVTKLIDADDLAIRGGGFGRYLSSCQFELSAGRNALALAFSTAFDGSGTVFAIIVWQAGDYSIVFNPFVAQGRMELGSLTLKLWKAHVGKNVPPDPTEFECVWCDHRYVVTDYAWRNGKYVKTGSRRSASKFDPGEISGTPLVLIMPLKVPAAR